jgi:hypothetical protein
VAESCGSRLYAYRSERLRDALRVPEPRGAGAPTKEDPHLAAPYPRVRVVRVRRVAAIVRLTSAGMVGNDRRGSRACRPMATYVLMQGDVPSPGPHAPIPAHPPTAR